MTELLAYAPLILTLALAGAAAGLAAGLFGIGGGAVIVPVLYFLFAEAGYQAHAMHVAVATSLATIIVTSLRSVRSHARRGAVDGAVLRFWAPWIVVGAGLGMLVAGIIPGSALTAIFGSLALILSAQLVFGRPSWRLAETLPCGAVRAGLGTGIGALSAIMGIGGGTFGVTLLTLFGRPIHQAIGTAAGFGVAIGLPGALAAILAGWGREGLPPGSLGFVNLPAFALISVFTVSLAPVGVALAHRLGGARLKQLFGALLAIVAVRMLYGIIAG